MSNTHALHVGQKEGKEEGEKEREKEWLGEKEGPLTSGTSKNIEKAGQPDNTIHSLAFLKVHFINCRMRLECTGSDGID